MTLTMGCQNEIIDCQNAIVQITVLPNMDDKTLCGAILELLEQAYQLRDVSHEWLQNPTLR
jgi:hypothetical protein